MFNLQKWMYYFIFAIYYCVFYSADVHRECSDVALACCYNYRFG